MRIQKRGTSPKSLFMGVATSTNASTSPKSNFRLLQSQINPRLRRSRAFVEHISSLEIPDFGEVVRL
jgi:hypothetical protein